MFRRNVPAVHAALITAIILFLPSAGSAHHEAMFGPQSSAVLSPKMFISTQVFDRENGRNGYKHRETTAVFSTGFTPFKNNPFSLAVVAPVTRESFTGLGATTMWEDPLISARYRVNAPGIAKALGVQESYVMGVGGVELPLGNKDHPSGHGPLGEISAGLFSVEKRPIAAIAYAYYHHTGQYNGVTVSSGNVFFGTGVAYTPIDDDAKGHLFSMQLGLSHEKTFPSFGPPVPDEGSSGVFLHPGIVFSTNPRFQYFGLVSLPVTQTYKTIDDRQEFRLGVGMIIMLGRPDEPAVKRP